MAVLPFIILAYYLFRKNKLLFKASVVLIASVFIHFLLLEYFVKPDNNSTFSGKIVDLEKKEKHQKITLKKGVFKLLIYDYDFRNLSVGDIVQGKGLALDVDPERIEGGFNYKDYLKHKKTIKNVICEEIEVKGRGISINLIKYYFLNYLENNFQGESLAFMKAMLIGDDALFSEEFKGAIANNGILHLFAVSGLHIILFVDIINKILQSFRIKENIIISGTCLFLFFYLIITSFSASVLRAALMYYLAVINKSLKLGFSSLDVISICFIILILINPYYMYDYGFILSFQASLVIILLSPLISKIGHFKQLLIISIFAALITLPVVININNDINLLSPFTNVIFIDLIEGIILPLSLVVLFLPRLSKVYEFLVIAFEKLTVFISNHLYLPIRLPDFSFLTTMIYYVLLITLGLFYHKRSLKNILIVSNIFFILILANIKFFKVSGEVNFLDLVNGESVLIETPFNECTALIDTGDGSNNDVIDFLKSRGIKKLDYLFITHNHYDHNGGAFEVIDNFFVKNIVISAYDDSGIGKYPKIIRVKAGDRVSCGKTVFHIIHPDDNYSDENDNSIIIYTKLGNKNFLFLGDAGKEVEAKIIDYNLEVDVIKVGHHGSATSTNPEFISKLRPEYAIIQTGRIEKFGFPHKQTIVTLESLNVKVFRTDQHYSIKYRFRKNESIFEIIR